MGKVDKFEQQMAAAAEGASSASLEIVLAVDIGSSSVRCCPFIISHSEKFISPKWRVPISRKAVRFNSLGTASGAEISGAATSVVQECIQELRKSLPNFCIRAIGFGCFAMSLIGVDASGIAVTPVFTYADRHPETSSALQILKQKLEAAGARAEIESRTGAPLHSSYAAPQLARLR